VSVANFAGLKIIFSMNALEATTERLFPESKHRSKRIRKKLIKRFGGEFRMQPCIFRMQPCIFRTPTAIIAHPSYRAALLSARGGET
jgi:hypothetical protein